MINKISFSIRQAIWKTNKSPPLPEAKKSQKEIQSVINTTAANSMEKKYTKIIANSKLIICPGVTWIIPALKDYSGWAHMLGKKLDIINSFCYRIESCLNIQF